MIYLLLAVGFILRLITLNQSLWLDESINVLFARQLDFWQFVTQYPVGDFHPPLYFGILWLWGHLFGFTEIAVRFPSVILGVLTIWLSFLLGKELFGKKVGLMSALFVAVNPLLIYYSQEARMYSLSAFAVSLCCYFFIKLMKDKKFFLPYLLSVGLVLYSEYLAFMILPAELIAIIWLDKKKWKEVLGGMILGGILFSPWLLVFPKQLSSGIQTSKNVPGWEKIVGQSSVKELVLVFVKGILGRASLTNKTVYEGLIVALALFYGWIIKPIKKIGQEEKLLWCFIIIPTVLAFLISFFVPILSYFRMIYILPSFLVLVAVGLDRLSPKVSKLCLAVILLVSLISLLAYYLNPNFQREDWKGLSVFLNSQAAPNSLVLFENNNLPAPYQYYDRGKIESLEGLSRFPAGSTNDVIDLNSVTSNKSKIFLVDYLVDISDPNRAIDRQLTEIGFRVNKVDNFSGVGFVYEYTR